MEPGTASASATSPRPGRALPPQSTPSSAPASSGASPLAASSSPTTPLSSSLKPRKPYTVSKPRETWTNEEHTKFIEALSLYERDWKRIGAHIGSKTIIQIRSHAQKYFLKMQKMGLDTYIPPPRPKRKSRKERNLEEERERDVATAVQPHGHDHAAAHVAQQHGAHGRGRVVAGLSGVGVISSVLQADHAHPPGQQHQQAIHQQQQQHEHRALLLQPHMPHPAHALHHHLPQQAAVHLAPPPGHALPFHPHPAQVASLPSLPLSHAPQHVPMTAQAIASKPVTADGNSLSILSSLSSQLLTPPGLGPSPQGIPAVPSPQPYAAVFDHSGGGNVMYGQPVPLQPYHAAQPGMHVHAALYPQQPQQQQQQQVLQSVQAVQPLQSTLYSSSPGAFAAPLAFSTRSAQHLHPGSLASPQSARTSSPAFPVHSPGGFQSANAVALTSSRASPFLPPAAPTHIRPTPTRPSPIITTMNEAAMMGGVKEEKREEPRDGGREREKERGRSDRGDRDHRERDGRSDREREKDRERRRRERERERDKEEERERERRLLLSKRRDSLAVMEDVSKTLASLRQGSGAPQPLSEKRVKHEQRSASDDSAASSDSASSGSSDSEDAKRGSRRNKRARKEKRKASKADRRNGSRKDRRSAGGHRRDSRSPDRKDRRGGGGRDGRRRSPLLAVPAPSASPAAASSPLSPFSDMSDASPSMAPRSSSHLSPPLRGPQQAFALSATPPLPSLSPSYPQFVDSAALYASAGVSPAPHTFADHAGYGMVTHLGYANAVGAGGGGVSVVHYAGGQGIGR